jgi:hypothetical protein
VALVIIVRPINVEKSLHDFLVFEGFFDDFVNVGNFDLGVEEFVRTDTEPIRHNTDKRTFLAKALATAFGEAEKIFAAIGTAIFVAKEGFDINACFFDFLFEGMKDFECAAGDATCTGTYDDSAVRPFHGFLIFFGTILEKLFGNCHWRIKRKTSSAIVLFLSKKSIDQN